MSKPTPAQITDAILDLINSYHVDLAIHYKGMPMDKTNASRRRLTEILSAVLEDKP